MGSVQSRPLSNLQLELLKLYSTEVTERQLLDIKKMLAAYFEAQIDTAMTELWQQNGWEFTTVENWKKEKLRIPYRDEI